MMHQPVEVKHYTINQHANNRIWYLDNVRDEGFSVNQWTTNLNRALLCHTPDEAEEIINQYKLKNADVGEWVQMVAIR